MKIALLIASGLLGFVFVASGLVVLLSDPAAATPPPEGSPAAHFMAAFMPTGYMKFVKVLEVLGGLLVAIPKTRRAGLLVLGPILVNIVAYHAFVMKGEGLFSPVLLALVAITLFITWAERAAFAQFLFSPSRAGSLVEETKS